MAEPDTSAGTVQSLLRGTPYLIGDGPDSLARFQAVSDRAQLTHGRAARAAEAIAEQARGVIPQFEAAIRSDLVAESNRMEGIPSSPRAVQELVRVKRDLLEMEVSGFVQ